MAISLIGIERAAYFRTFFHHFSASRAIESTGEKVLFQNNFLYPFTLGRTRRDERAFSEKYRARDAPRRDFSLFYFSSPPFIIYFYFSPFSPLFAEAPKPRSSETTLKGVIIGARPGRAAKERNEKT